MNILQHLTTVRHFVGDALGVRAINLGPFNMEIGSPEPADVAMARTAAELEYAALIDDMIEAGWADTNGTTGAPGATGRWVGFSLHSSDALQLALVAPDCPNHVRAYVHILLGQSEMGTRERDELEMPFRRMWHDGDFPVMRQSPSLGYAVPIKPSASWLAREAYRRDQSFRQKPRA